jgi:hypothetical protein
VAGARGGLADRFDERLDDLEDTTERHGRPMEYRTV